MGAASRSQARQNRRWGNRRPVGWGCELQFVAEADAFRGAWLLRGGRDAEAGVAGADELDETAGVGFEGVGGLRQVKPFAEDGMRLERGEVGAEAGVVGVKGADEDALPGFSLGRQEKLVTAVEHDRAAAEPRFEEEGGFGEEGFGEPLERVVGFDGARADGGGAGGFHGGVKRERAGWSGSGGDRQSLSQRSSRAGRRAGRT